MTDTETIPATETSGNIDQKGKASRTQWGAQFLAAAELVRRGYTVSFTMGNTTPLADLMVAAPSGAQFMVDVKGLSSKNAWIVRNKPLHLNLWYIFVYMAPQREQDHFYILTQKNVNELIAAFQKSHPAKGNVTMPGFAHKDAERVPHDWEQLPK